MNECSGAALKTLIRMQQNEIDEYHIYQKNLQKLLNRKRTATFCFKLHRKKLRMGNCGVNIPVCSQNPTKGSFLVQSACQNLWLYLCLKADGKW